ncbi:hypothetical protein ACP70R_009564 [Stipagrostis hirtigluma subsp. patula]
MASMPVSYSRFLLSDCADEDDVDDEDDYSEDRSSGSSGGGDACPANGARRSERESRGGDDEAGGDAYLKRRETAPGYVSFEDVIGSEEFREGSARPPEAGITDPLVRTASRLYLRGAPQPRHRRRSPGPLGTRRGSALHVLVKKYVNPCLGFVVSAFCRGQSPCQSPSDQ